MEKKKPEVSRSITVDERVERREIEVSEKLRAYEQEKALEADLGVGRLGAFWASVRSLNDVIHFWLPEPVVDHPAAIYPRVLRTLCGISVETTYDPDSLFRRVNIERIDVGFVCENCVKRVLRDEK